MNEFLNKIDIFLEANDEVIIIMIFIVIIITMFTKIDCLETRVRKLEEKE